jgi:hypothetical protein
MGLDCRDFLKITDTDAKLVEVENFRREIVEKAVAAMKARRVYALGQA